MNLPKSIRQPFLCVITDDSLADDAILAASRAACRAVPLLLQLRARNRDGRRLFELATALRRITREHRCLLLVNDRMDVALAAEADGIHLPGHGLPVAGARSALAAIPASRRPLLGLSVHSPEEIRHATSAVDYVQFGPVFATPSKAAYGPAQGTGELQRAVAAAGRTPVIAVGGIEAGNAAGVAAAGAAGAAVIRAVMRSDDPGAAASQLTAALRS